MERKRRLSDSSDGERKIKKPKWFVTGLFKCTIANVADGENSPEGDCDTSGYLENFDEDMEIQVFDNYRTPMEVCSEASESDVEETVSEKSCEKNDNDSDNDADDEDDDDNSGVFCDVIKCTCCQGRNERNGGAPEYRESPNSTDSDSSDVTLFYYSDEESMDSDIAID